MHNKHTTALNTYRIPAFSGHVTVITAALLSALVVSSNDISESCGISSISGIDHLIDETESGLSIEETPVVEESNQTSKDGRRARSSNSTLECTNIHEWYIPINTFPIVRNCNQIVVTESANIRETSVAVVEVFGWW